MDRLHFALLLYSLAVRTPTGRALPDINLQRTTETVLGAPWSAFNRVPIHFYPEMVGIAYLLTLEVGSHLVFYWFRRVQEFIRLAVGVKTAHYDFFKYQTIGGYAVLAVSLLWSARAHLRRVLAVTLAPAPRPRRDRCR